MQIVVKVAAERVGEGVQLIREAVDSALDQDTKDLIGVSKVFPENTPGQRGRIFTLQVPDHIPEQQCQALIQSLRDHKSLESAEAATPKRPQ
jgi:hypothetical protein